MKVFIFFINIIYWISLFIIPAGILGYIGLSYYIHSNDNLIISIIFWIFGVVLGIFLAEVIRRKYGLDNFFGRILATPDIDGGNILDKKYADPDKEKHNCEEQ